MLTLYLQYYLSQSRILNIYVCNDLQILSTILFQMFVSGGVDSTVCTALLQKALTKHQVIAVHIDNGFMRKNESNLVEQSLQKIGVDLKGKLVKCLFLLYLL